MTAFCSICKSFLSEFKCIKSLWVYDEINYFFLPWPVGMYIIRKMIKEKVQASDKCINLVMTSSSKHKSEKIKDRRATWTRGTNQSNTE